MQRPKRITLTVTDGHPRHVRKGDFVQSPRSKYYVLSSRKVDTKDGSTKFTLGVINVDDIPKKAFVWKMQWHKR